MNDLHSKYLLATDADYERLFRLLEWWVKPLLEREIEKDNLLKIQANQSWIAWLNLKEIVMTMLRNKLSAAEAIDSLDLSKHILQSGYNILDMHRWVDMLVAADEEERGRVAKELETLTGQRELAQTAVV